MEFNSKEELTNFIRDRVRQIIGKTDSIAYQGEPESPMNIMISNFPQLSQTLEKLMGPQFRIFVDDIQWVSPKPTTFKVMLPSGQSFTLIWNEKDFLAKVAGVKYDMQILQEYQRAIMAISELLQYGPLSANLSPEDLARHNLTPTKGEPAIIPPGPGEPK